MSMSNAIMDVNQSAVKILGLSCLTSIFLLEQSKIELEMKIHSFTEL